MDPTEHMVRGFLDSYAHIADAHRCLRRVIASAPVGDEAVWSDVANDIDTASPLAARAARLVGRGDVRGAAECFARRERTTVEAILAVHSLYGRWPAPDGVR